MILRCLCTLVAVVIWSPAVPYAAAGRQPADLAAITVDVPAKGSIYPPDMAAPTFLWRDPTGTATGWRIEVSFEDRGPAIRKTVKGEPLRVGEIDQACVSPLVELPRLTPDEAAAHSWRPDPETWAAIKKRSVKRPATVTILGFAGPDAAEPASRGQSNLQTSKDPVGAPIFYRDVPLIPSVGEKGVVSPLPKSAIGLIKWRLRDLGRDESKTLMENLPTCANCHSFSRDGKTMGLDVDGPQNDKGLYALVPVTKETAIRNEYVIKWSNYRPIEKSVNIRVTFMSQVSPDGRYLVTMINNPGTQQTGPGLRPQERMYVANFKDFRFGQVFYPTRGVLAFYDSVTKQFRTLPGADDPRYVQAGGFWSPDGKYIIFSRAEAKEPFPEGWVPAQYANDPNETQIQYDLYRIPFNEGRGGVPEPIPGASQNGASNNFPKVSPDGRWIVFVQCRNGLLMRPDSRLYIMPFKGGRPRLMNCNTSLMNSWHSFSPNGRWMVFASKARSPYTDMYLTHIDEDGNDSPPILIENAKAANRAINIPEFINLPAGGLEKIDTPAADYYRAFDIAMDLSEKKRYAEAIPAWNKAVALGEDEAHPHFQLGYALGQLGRVNEEIAEYREAIRIEPRFAPTYTNLAIALQGQGKDDEAVELYRKSLELQPNDPKVRGNLAVALAAAGRLDEGIEECRAVLSIDPQNADVHNALAIALARKGDLQQATVHLETAVAIAPGSVNYQFNLARVLAASQRFKNAIPHLQAASDLTGGREPVILEMLASLHGELGQYREGVQIARRALAEAQLQNNRELVGELTKMVEYFQSKLTD